MSNSSASKPNPVAGIDKNGVRARRPTYQHGIPIAVVVTKLLAMESGKRAQTVGQVQQMLEQEYKALGSDAPPPHARNLEGIASGILSVVTREVRHLQKPKAK